MNPLYGVSPAGAGAAPAVAMGVWSWPLLLTRSVCVTARLPTPGISHSPRELCSAHRRYETGELHS